MFDQFLPARADNTYRGNKIALWLFALIVLVKAIQSVTSIFKGRLVAISADGIPIGTFSSAGAATVVSCFASLGLSNLIICLICMAVLIRYRSMVPVMFALLLLQHLGGRLIALLLPIVRTGTPPGFYVTLGLIGLLSVGLALSLWSQSNLQLQRV